MSPTPACLSVAMIVKDEALLLPEFLAGAGSFADEICVVDTGSSDGSAAIAREAGCRVLEIPWRDHFADARNASLQLCTGDWIFVLDADERIAPNDFPGLRKLLDGPRKRCFRFATRNYTNNDLAGGFVPAALDDPMARGFRGWFPSTKIRLFPSRARIRFHGAVHELINPSIEGRGFRIFNCDFSVHHYPLLKPASALAAKRELYLRLCREKVKEDAQDARAQAELGDQFAEMGLYPEAVAAYRESLRLRPESAECLKDLGACLYFSGHANEAEQAFQLALKLEPTLVDAWRNLGVLLSERGAWQDALKCFEEALKIAPDHPTFRHYRDLAQRQAARQ